MSILNTNTLKAKPFLCNTANGGKLLHGPHRPERCLVCMQTNVWLTASHLAGVLNTEAVVQLVLDDDDLKTLMFKELSFKLVMLLLLVTGQGGQTVHMLDLRYTTTGKDSYTFVIADRLTQSKPGVPNLPVASFL